LGIACRVFMDRVIPVMIMLASVLGLIAMALLLIAVITWSFGR
jgi:hypothetical protein